MEQSSKRKQTLKEFQVLCNVDTKKIIKHVSTRWLSLGQCLSRLMTRWEPLSSFFRTDAQNLERLKVHLNKSRSSSRPVTSTLTSKSKTEGSNSKSQTSEDASKHRDTGHLSQRKDFNLSSYLFKQQTIAEKSVAAKIPKPNTTASIDNAKTSNSKGSSSSKSPNVLVERRKAANTKLKKNSVKKEYSELTVFCRIRTPNFTGFFP